MSTDTEAAVWLTACSLRAEVAELHHLLSVAAEVARERAEKIAETTAELQALREINRDRGWECETLRAELAKYETAFAGFWIEEDGDGDPTVWYQPTDHPSPVALLNPIGDNGDPLFDALAAVLPTEAPTQGAES